MNLKKAILSGSFFKNRFVIYIHDTTTEITSSQNNRMIYVIKWTICVVNNQYIVVYSVNILNSLNNCKYVFIMHIYKN